ncbi:serine/threonine-protein kinase [Streptomyces sanglieri]|uniref:Serine/threonine-protein kinase n=1 Tax=Streptomyces sanglieri TaxID=193460 RepID=A0ABW2WKR8_9ACTN
MADAANVLKGQVATTGAVVISSARHDLPALAPIGETYTAFTGELLQVLTHGIDGGSAEISIDAAYAHVKEALIEQGRPIPDRTGTDTSGTLVIARNPKFRPHAPGAPPRAVPGTHLLGLANRLIPMSANARSTRTAAQGSAEPGPVGERYGVLHPLGHGGMGSVHVAYDRLLDRQVALKTIQSRGQDEPVEREVFWAEVRAAAGLNHPNVAAIHDVVEGEAERFFVMELVPGINLSAALDIGSPLSPDEAAEVVHDVLSGLEAAHQAGVVHCDVKPANIMLTPSGTVKILDFGISHIGAEKGFGPQRRRGTVVGTPVYTAPENFRGQLPTPSADVYGAGVVFYQLCTGQVPFPADEVFEVIARALAGPPTPPSQLRPGLPSEYQAIIMRALEPDPVGLEKSSAQVKRRTGTR